MSAITVRNLPEETHQALKQLAIQHGRSTEAEVREILKKAAHPKTRIKIGSELADFGKRWGGVDFKITRDQTPSEPAAF